MYVRRRFFDSYRSAKPVYATRVIHKRHTEIRRVVAVAHLQEGNRSGGYRCMVTTAPNSSRKTGLRPRAGSSGTASTVLAGPSGALGSTGELAADLFEA